MKNSEVKRFATLYERYLKLLKLQGKSESTISPIPELSAASVVILIVARTS